jgi:hypothetical protein
MAKTKQHFWQRVFSRSPDLRPDKADKPPVELKGIAYYLEERLRKQREWYESKASHNKKHFMRTQTVILVLSALIPLLVVFDGALSILLDGLVEKFFISMKGSIEGHEPPNWANVFSVLISAVIIVLTSMDKLYQPQTNWFNYRANEELLKKEEWMFRYQVGPYTLSKVMDKQERAKLRAGLLVERVESIISADIASFTQSERTIEIETSQVNYKKPTDAPTGQKQ